MLLVGTTYIVGNIAKALLSNGIDGQSYQIVCIISTTGGLVATSTGTLLIAEGIR
jgi:hypothetical protein